ncbi:MAG: hypothetical protein ACI3YC_02225 [Alloprevotella sp.]
MTGICVYIKLEKYLKEWLEFHFGNPVCFPKQSYENELLHSLLQRQPSNFKIEKKTSELCAIKISDSRHRKPEHYNYLGVRGKQTIVSAIDTIFKISLWSDCLKMIHSKKGLNKSIENWCRENGINLDHSEAVRQQFYRMRRKYCTFGIILGKTRKKNCEKGVEKRTTFETPNSKII